MLLPGLKFLAAQLKMAENGHFPHRHPLDRIDIQSSKVCRNQAYYPDMAAVTFAARDKVGDDDKSSGKLRLHVFELSALALALRVALRGKLIPSPSVEPPCTCRPAEATGEVSQAGTEHLLQEARHRGWQGSRQTLAELRGLDPL